MCLGVPGQIIAVDGMTAVVDFSGVRRRVALDLVDEDVSIGDHVLVHGQLVRRFYRSGAGARSLTEVVASGIKKLGGEAAEEPDPGPAAS